MPRAIMEWSAEAASCGAARICVTHFSSSVRLLPPVSSFTLSSESRPRPSATACSVSESASRSAPSACRASSQTASSSASMFSCAQTYLSLSTVSAIVILWNGMCWQRERIVTGTLCGSVVARRNTTFDGGSSSVLSSALKACSVSMWTSSMM